MSTCLSPISTYSSSNVPVVDTRTVQALLHALSSGAVGMSLYVVGLPQRYNFDIKLARASAPALPQKRIMPLGPKIA